MPSDAIIRVLIVDDELSIRELSKEFLDGFNGLEVEIAASAREARRVHARTTFDVIVSDYQMPEEDGIQFLKSLRASGDRTPFILFTGKGREEVVIEALNNDADSYMQKGGHPLSLYTELEHRIRVTVGKRQAETALKTSLREMQRANEDLATAEEELRAQIDEIKASNEELRVKDERLRLNEVRLDNLFENMSNGAAVHAIILDPSGVPYDYRFLNVNHAFERMTGLKRSAILGRTVREVLHQIEPIWIERYGRVALTGAPDHFESYSAALERDYSVSVYQNDPGQFTTLLLDITERVRAEKAVREMSIKYQTLMRTLPVGVTISDRKGNIIESNEEAERLLGLSQEEQKRRSIAGGEWKIVRSDGTPMPPEEFASTRALTEGHIIQNIEMGLVGDGHITWINVAAAPIPLEGHGVAIAYSDITGQKKAEEEREQTNAFLNNLLDYANAPIIVWDPQMRITIFNHAFERLTGMRAESVIGRGLGLLFPKESREESLALSQQTSAGHRWEVVEIPIQTKDGSVRTVLWNSATLNSPQGEIIATIAQGQDITERKRAESTLLESERRFKGLFDTMGSGVAIYAVRNDGENGADYIIQDFNHRALEIEGKSKTEVVGRSLADLRPNIDSYGLIPIFHQVWKTGQPAFYPAKIYVDEHYVNWYENTIFRLPSGEIVAIYDDVTERKRAEEELKLKDSAVTSSINAIAIADLAGSLTYVNPAFLKIWGYEDRQEALGRSALSFWKNPEEARRTMQEIRAQGKWSGEMEGQRKDGASIQVQLLANLIRDDSDTPVAMMASFIDITERKRAEMEIRQTKEQLEESNHLARIGTWDWIMETDSVLWSDELSRIAGRDPSLPAPSFADQPQFYTPTSWKILSEAVTLALTDHEPYQLELEMVRVDGSIREIIAIGTVKLDLTGKVIGLHGTVQDITERKRAEKALHEANRKLNLLSSTTRHDINNQITTLLGNLILLKKRQPQLSSDDNLQKVEKAAEQLAATIRFTKNYEDIGVKAPSWASIDRQIREAFTLLHPAGVELKTDTEGVEVLADPLFERIPHNLIDNSMRHGEHVTRIKMSMEQKGDAVLVVYEDDGVGISDDDKKHIFEKGFGKNTGFGLFLCQEILAITGITITETGKAGEGARFEMLVPAGGWRFAR